MSDVIFNTVIFTDGTTILPTPEGAGDDMLDTFIDEDKRWKDTGIRLGLKNKIYFDMQTIDEDGAWVVVSGPIPCSESKLLEIVEKEKSAIWHRRSYQNYLGMFKEFFNPEKTM